MSALSPRELRIEELLIEQAVFGLSPEQEAELLALQRDADAEANPYMQTAALVQLGFAALDKAASGDGMPAELRAKIAAGAASRR